MLWVPRESNSAWGGDREAFIEEEALELSFEDQVGIFQAARGGKVVPSRRNRSHELYGLVVRRVYPGAWIPAQILCSNMTLSSYSTSVFSSIKWMVIIWVTGIVVKIISKHEC